MIKNPCSVLAYVGKKKEQWQGRPLGLEERLTLFFTNGFIHGAKLFHKKESLKEQGKVIEKTSLKLSHIITDYEQVDIDLYKLCISDIWEIDIIPLIPSRMQSVLEQTYGTNWQDIVKQKYLEIEQKLHLGGEQKFARIDNLQQKRLFAGLANHAHLLKALGVKEIVGHKRETEKDLKKLYKKFYEGGTIQEDQICSEFASKTTAAAMMELNRVLAEDICKQTQFQWATSEAVLAHLKTNGVNVPTDIEDYLNGVRHYKKRASLTKEAKRQLIKILNDNGYDKWAIKLIIRLSDQEIFDLPYSRKERFKAIHPGRMVSLLVDKQCAKLKDPPPVLAAFVDVNA